MSRSPLLRELEAAYRERTPRSRALHERASLALPGGDTRTGTFFLPYPTFIERGSGCRVLDVDGNEYLDLLNNFTSLVHGHAHPATTRAIAEQAARGTAHGAPVERQIALAEAIRERLPSIERLRFANSGTEAVMMAIRAARAFTGKPGIVKIEGAYHGSYDTARVSSHPSGPPSWPQGEPDEPGLSPGLVAETLVVPFNDLDAATAVLEAHRDDVAAVIVEPVMGAAGMIPAEPGFLAGLSEATRALGILLIFDEVITFRLARGGGQSLAGVTPDLTTLGKVIGGGLPIGAFGGAEAVMAAYDPRRPDAIGHSGTYNGNAATMEAGLATLGALTPGAIEELDALGERLRVALRDSLDRAGVPGQVTGIGSLGHVHFTDAPVRDYRSAARADARCSRLLHVAMLNRGIFVASRSMFVLSTPMSAADVDRAADAFGDSLDALRPALLEATAARG